MNSIFKASLFFVLLALHLGACASTPEPVAQHSLARNTASTTKVANAGYNRTVAEMIDQAWAGCRYLQDSSDVPISCHLDRINDNPAMYVTFGDVSAAKNYLDVVLDRLGAPYCIAASELAVNAYLVLEVRRSQVINVYSCLTGDFSGWRSYASG